MSTSRRLADGFYEEVVTGGLARALELAARERHIDTRDLGDDAHVILARLLRGQIERAFADVGSSDEDKLARQVQLAEKLLGVLEEHRLIDTDQRLSRPARELRATPDSSCGDAVNANPAFLRSYLVIETTEEAEAEQTVDADPIG